MCCAYCCSLDGQLRLHPARQPDHMCECVRRLGGCRGRKAGNTPATPARVVFDNVGVARLENPRHARLRSPAARASHHNLRVLRWEGGGKLIQKLPSTRPVSTGARLRQRAAFWRRTLVTHLGLQGGRPRQRKGRDVGCAGAMCALELLQCSAEVQAARCVSARASASAERSGGGRGQMITDSHHVAAAGVHNVLTSRPDKHTH